MTLGILWGAVVSMPLVVGVSLVSILQAADWTRVPAAASHYFSTCISTTNSLQDLSQHAVMGLSK